MKKIKDLTATVSGNLTVTSIADERDRQGKILWNCDCKCGKKIKVRTYNLTCSKLNSRITSCGCKNKEASRVEDMAINQKFAMYRRDCLLKNLPFEMTKEMFAEIIRQNCYYCDSLPKPWSPYLDKDGRILKRYIGKVNEEYMKSTAILMTGIDRLDSKLGYVVDNIVPCCTTCNIMKNILKKDEFLEQIKKIYLKQQYG